MISHVPIYMAFAAGLISFLSPCVLPLVPAYISFITGVSTEELSIQRVAAPFSLQGKEKSLVLINALLFVTGFSVVFIILGASATWIGTFLSSKVSLLTKIAGAVIIFFGIFKMGLIRPLVLHREFRFHPRERRYGFIGAFLVGGAFAFGWTPCIGPILAGILAYAGTLEKVDQGILLLLVYALGMGIPFLLTAVGVNRFFRIFSRMKKHLGLIEKASGLVMVLLGIMIVTNKLVLIPGYLAFLNGFAW